jgi:hypothetical protein
MVRLYIIGVSTVYDQIGSLVIRKVAILISYQIKERENISYFR